VTALDTAGSFIFTSATVTPCTLCSAATLSYTQASSLQGNAGLSNSGANGDTPTSAVFAFGPASAYQAGVGATAARYPYAASCAVQYKNYGAFATRQNTNAYTASTLGHYSVGHAYVTPPPPQQLALRAC